MFADKVEIEIRAGKGGDGRMSFRHEKYRAMGGPDGGDGGKGGDVIFRVSHNLNTLSKYKTNRLIHAEDGETGGGNRKKGKSGEDTVVPMPMGTLVIEDDLVVADLTEDGQEAVIARGGRGGFGNAHFVASTRQAPRIAERGEPGEVKKLILELKLVADVGLVGLPNAGKSTLLSVISNAKPEIGDYPFTTLIPNLGVVDFEDNTFLVADIPGLIEGASEGKGLGDDFLRHVERTAVILHLVDAYSEDVAGDWKTISHELAAYEIDLSKKPRIAVLTKIEGLPEKDVKAKMAALKKVSKTEVFAISSVAHKGLDALLRRTLELVNVAKKVRAEAEAEKPKKVITQDDFPDLWRVEEEDGTYRVIGGRIESFALRTDWDSPDGVERMRDILRKIGVAKQLIKMGLKPGDMIKIGKFELEWL